MEVVEESFRAKSEKIMDRKNLLSARKWVYVETKSINSTEGWRSKSEKRMIKI